MYSSVTARTSLKCGDDLIYNLKNAWLSCWGTKFKATLSGLLAVCWRGRNQRRLAWPLSRWTSIQSFSASPRGQCRGITSGQHAKREVGRPPTFAACSSGRPTSRQFFRCFLPRLFVDGPSARNYQIPHPLSPGPRRSCSHHSAVPAALN